MFVYNRSSDTFSNSNRSLRCKELTYRAKSLLYNELKATLLSTSSSLSTLLHMNVHVHTYGSISKRPLATSPMAKTTSPKLPLNSVKTGGPAAHANMMNEHTARTMPAMVGRLVS